MDSTSELSIIARWVQRFGRYPHSDLDQAVEEGSRRFTAKTQEQVVDVKVDQVCTEKDSINLRQ